MFIIVNKLKLGNEDIYSTVELTPLAMKFNSLTKVELVKLYADKSNDLVGFNFTVEQGDVKLRLNNLTNSKVSSSYSKTLWRISEDLDKNCIWTILGVIMQEHLMITPLLVLDNVDEPIFNIQPMVATNSVLVNNTEFGIFDLQQLKIRVTDSNIAKQIMLKLENDDGESPVAMDRDVISIDMSKVTYSQNIKDTKIKLMAPAMGKILSNHIKEYSESVEGYKLAYRIIMKVIGFNPSKDIKSKLVDLESEAVINRCNKDNIVDLLNSKEVSYFYPYSRENVLKGVDEYVLTGNNSIRNYYDLSDYYYYKYKMIELNTLRLYTGNC